MVAPASLCSRWARYLVCPRGRLVVYALVLTILAGVCCFYRLSEGTLFGDEAAFACTTERMRVTGDYVIPFITDKPHLNATPLYNWLTLALAPWSDGTPLWYRFWSAAFGVGCVLMTFALGTFLFRAEVGLLAGLFLVFNRDFLFCHGIRFGGMDAMVAFFVFLAALTVSFPVSFAPLTTAFFVSFAPLSTATCVLCTTFFAVPWAINAPAISALADAPAKPSTNQLLRIMSASAQ